MTYEDKMTANICCARYIASVCMVQIFDIICLQYENDNPNQPSAQRSSENNLQNSGILIIYRGRPPTSRLR